jgi:hypothetical protein
MMGLIATECPHIRRNIKNRSIEDCAVKSNYKTKF